VTRIRVRPQFISWDLKRNTRYEGLLGHTTWAHEFATHKDDDHEDTRAMDESSRVHITVCGDGGCGSRAPPKRANFVADTRAGKSSITLRLVRSQWTSDYDPTIGMRASMPLRLQNPTTN
jgi:hypothetical protein